MTITEHLVKGVYDNLCRINGEWQPIGPNDIKEVLTAAIPFLPVQEAVKADTLKLIERMAFGYEVMFEKLSHISGTSGVAQSWYRSKAREATERLSPLHSITTESNKSVPGDCKRQYQDFMSRILSALEPSVARELALVDALEVAKMELQAWIKCADENGLCVTSTPEVIDHIDIALAALSSPDHADAGKVEGDGRADLERFWRPISEADKSITFEQTFDLGDGEKMTIRNSDEYWVRDDDGRVYRATWSDHKVGYWWDIDGESPVDPVEYMPHPLSLPASPGA